MMQIPKWPGRDHRIGVYTYRILWGRLLFASLIVSVTGFTCALLQPANPTPKLAKPESVQRAAEPENKSFFGPPIPGNKLNEQRLELRLDKDGSIPVLETLTRWQWHLGHVVVADKSIRPVKIKLLNHSTDITWEEFKAVLQANTLFAVEEEVYPGRLLIRVLALRILRIGPPTPTSIDKVTSIDTIPTNIGEKVFRQLRSIVNKNLPHTSSITYLYNTNKLIMTGSKAKIIRNRKLVYQLIEKLSREQSDAPAPQ